MKIKEFEFGDWVGESIYFAKKSIIKINDKTLNELDQEVNCIFISIYDGDCNVCASEKVCSSFPEYFSNIKASSIEEAKKEVDKVLYALSKFPAFV